MALATQAQNNDLDALFAALANRTRRSIVLRLEQGDATISELAAPFDMTLAAVSKHLHVLENAGLVVRTQEGKSRRCSLDAEALAHAESWLRSRRQLWETALDSFARHVEEQEARRTTETTSTKTGSSNQ